MRISQQTAITEKNISKRLETNCRYSIRYYLYLIISPLIEQKRCEIQIIARALIKDKRTRDKLSASEID